VTDGVGAIAEVCGTITRPPRLVARDDFYACSAYNTNRTVVSSESIFGNDGPSPTGGAISMRNITRDVPPAHGVLTDVDLAAGTFTFTPARGFRGNTTFEYGACRRPAAAMPHAPACRLTRLQARPLTPSCPPHLPPAPLPPSCRDQGRHVL
jgi:hypothetical protein